MKIVEKNILSHFKQEKVYTSKVQTDKGVIKLLYPVRMSDNQIIQVASKKYYEPRKTTTTHRRSKRICR